MITKYWIRILLWRQQAFTEYPFLVKSFIFSFQILNAVIFFFLHVLISISAMRSFTQDFLQIYSWIYRNPQNVSFSAGISSFEEHSTSIYGRTYKASYANQATVGTGEWGEGGVRRFITAGPLKRKDWSRKKDPHLFDLLQSISHLDLWSFFPDDYLASSNSILIFPWETG